ncbi:hypothetical protein M501DRAFT_935188 [Patellaria atrata CBS 101060]|uniref:HTH APSES-type domain-containing protein n=1 Tax=Patellaria atrata CBS 101060 TaxID=1346257 RepID=A0A9P4VMQ3_9PEZI|nr:hypothetical protein M501DRAFT_935188 [Patellaria atrata CBS 101060]
MVHKRQLPALRNPLIAPEHTPQVEILVERRRLGQTNLSVRPGQIGVTPSSRSENLGVFDYAHLRVPLPKDLKGSGIFSLQKNNAYPESYFLMRRSSDGFISATGMFKAAFPWASSEEEETERKYHKNLPTSGPEEVAGNVWIAPEQALKLAEEYGMTTWIVALLDPEAIEPGTKDKKHDIATPPKFVLPEKGALLPPQSANTASVRRSKREMRSVSPSKIATPSRKIASPRKPRVKKVAKTEPSAASIASSALQIALENGTEVSQATESVVSESVNGETIRVQVDETVEKNGDVETTTTAVKIDMPADAPTLPLPESPEAMLAKATEMVEEAKKLESSRSDTLKPTKRSKRKAEEVEMDEDGERPLEAPAKKAKVVEETRKDKVRFRAALGIGATLAIG